MITVLFILLNAILITAKIVGVVAVIAILALGAVFVYDEIQGRKRDNAAALQDQLRAIRRAEKEAEAAASGGYFEESFRSGSTTGEILYRQRSLPHYAGLHRYPYTALEAKAEKAFFDDIEEL